MRLKSAILCALTSAPAFLLFAQKNPPSEGREVTKLYDESCASCHGSNLEGASASGLIDSKWRFGNTDAGIFTSIHDGYPEAGMPAMRQTISNAETRALVIYIREKEAQFHLEHSFAPAKPATGVVIQSERESFRLEPVVAGLAEPWSVAFLPDGRMLVTERTGRLRIVEANRQLASEPVRGVPPVFGGEGGLLDVALHPDYGRRAGSDWIYLSYGAKSADGNGMAAILRGRLQNGALVDQQQIFLAPPSSFRPGGMRFGSKIIFDKKRHLFFSVGDRGAPGDEQDLTRPNGKIHRVLDDGRIPPDNPFVHEAGALASIWTYGHRNPQGLAFNPLTSELWETEHGPRGGDELNVIGKGRNYGWPVITYGMNYDGTPITDHLAQPGMEQPVTNWVPSLGISSLAFYTGGRFPGWKNNIFVASLRAQELRRLELDGGGNVIHQELLFKGAGRIRDVVNGPGGYLYLVFNQPDRIERIAPGAPSTASISTSK